MKNPSSPVRRPGWRRAVAICIFVAILGFGAYYHPISTRTDETGNSDSKGLMQPVSETEADRPPEEPESGIILEETRITLPERDGTRGWSFGAERIEYDEDRNSACLIVVEGTRFVDDVPQLEIRAGAVKLDFATGTVDFEDHVTVKSDKGLSFSAEGATWDPGKKNFRAYGRIHYKNGASEILGDEMEIDSELETIRVKGNVRFRSPVF